MMHNCARCNSELTDENWMPSMRRTNVHRCNKCEYLRQKDWAIKTGLNRYHKDARERSARWRIRHPDHWRIYYAEHRENSAKRAILLLWKYKLSAFEILGGRCEKCGNNDPRILDINHKNHRDISEKRMFGMKMYKIIVNGTRKLDDLNLLCCNCNRLYEYETGRRKMPPPAKLIKA